LAPAVNLAGEAGGAARGGGSLNNQIAARLGVSLATVKRHLANVMLKWECHNRTQVAVAAIAAGALVSARSR